MSDIAIRVENLGKRYRIGRAQKRHDTLRDQISDLRFKISDLASQSARAILCSNHKSEIINQKSDNYIWALKDVSFKVKRGEVVGIPLTALMDTLLEVGTGFHAELPGRDAKRIYLSGATLRVG